MQVFVACQLTSCGRRSHSYGSRIIEPLERRVERFPRRQDRMMWLGLLGMGSTPIRIRFPDNLWQISVVAVCLFFTLQGVLSFQLLFAKGVENLRIT